MTHMKPFLVNSRSIRDLYNSKAPLFYKLTLLIEPLEPTMADRTLEQTHHIAPVFTLLD
jgi:hypothetical protein